MVTDYMCQGKKEEENFPAMTHRYHDSKIYIQKRGGRLIVAIINNTDNMKINRTEID